MDSCWAPDYRTPFDDDNGRHNYYFRYGKSFNTGDSGWHKPTHFFEQSLYMKEYPMDSLKFMVISCPPMISFMDSNTHKNNVFAIWAGGSDPEQGELTFISDSEFVVNPLYGVKYYLKITKTPKEFYKFYDIPEPKNSD